MWKVILASFLTGLLTACASTHQSLANQTPPPPKAPSIWTMSEIQQGKRYFQQGYYKHAMQSLLPLAMKGNPESQYAVGYMYYYGYGVAQDTDVGYFWTQQSARQGCQRAIDALHLIEATGNDNAPMRTRR